MPAQEGTQIPVTVLTGFLGSGKTTLLNYILSEKHGKKIAVVENEFGEVGVDDALVVQAEEEIFEMSNGCICCTVRGDLIRILGVLSKRRTKFDAVLIETTGLADPAPVAQTFFVDPEISSVYKLDAIVTLVDCKHILEHLDEQKPEGVENEAVEQLAFADRIILNKTDLVTDELELEKLRRRIRGINAVAPIINATYGKVDLGAIMGIGAFSLSRVLEQEPEFLSDQDHQHDLSITSVGIRCKGAIDITRLNTWISKFLRENGTDVFRSKGVINVKGEEQRFVFQAVHMLFDGRLDRAWKSDEERENRLIFIGRKLNREYLESSFQRCIVKEDS